MSLRAPARVFWVALIVRLLYMTLTHQYRITVIEDHFRFGYEAGRIARSLVEGGGYADPFSNYVLRHTGPTAWLPPLYPLILAGSFRFFGVYTQASAWVVLALNCVFSAWTARAVWEIGARCLGRRVGVWSGWLWALYPAAMQYAVHWVWEMTLTTALLAWVLVLMLRMRGIGEEQTVAATASVRAWALFGLMWGFIALSNSSLLLFLPVCGVWLLLGKPGLLRSLRGAGLAALVFLGCVTPWTWRNWRVFHAFVPMRGNLGVEAYLGNGPGSNGLLMEYDHPYQAPDQLRLYASMGEVRYAAMRGRLASANIQAHPAHFMADVLKRIYYFWVSLPHSEGSSMLVEAGRVLNYAFVSLAGLLGLMLALWRRRPAAWLLMWAFVLLPLPYYLVTVHARFRHPLEPLICCLAVYLFQSAGAKGQAAHRQVR